MKTEEEGTINGSGELLFLVSGLHAGRFAGVCRIVAAAFAVAG